jgi:glycosyltransferase involved in cell wall biosynthesis
VNYRFPNISEANPRFNLSLNLYRQFIDLDEMLSIIIPTYNEERFIGRLLESIKRQKFPDYEVIVADNKSKDTTCQIANKYKARIVKGGLPAEARNIGAANAKGDILLFLDSDVILPYGFLHHAVSDFKKKELDVALASIIADSNKQLDKIMYSTADAFLKAWQYFKALGAGCCGIMIKKDLHDLIGGFNERIKFGEDTDYLVRAGRVGKFRVLSARIKVSVRRFDAEGRFKLAMKYAQSTYYDIAGTPEKKKKIVYKMNRKYAKKKKRQEKNRIKNKLKLKKLIGKYARKKKK